MTLPTTGPLVNQLGTGAIPADDERWLLDRGMKFAAWFYTPHGTRVLIFSGYANMYQRLGEQLERVYDEDHGLPVQYRIPSHPAPRGCARGVACWRQCTPAEWRGVRLVLSPFYLCPIYASKKQRKEGKCLPIHPLGKRP